MKYYKVVTAADNGQLYSFLYWKHHAVTYKINEKTESKYPDKPLFVFTKLEHAKNLAEYDIAYIYECEIEPWNGNKVEFLRDCGIRYTNKIVLAKSVKLTRLVPD